MLLWCCLTERYLWTYIDVVCLELRKAGRSGEADVADQQNREWNGCRKTSAHVAFFFEMVLGSTKQSLTSRSLDLSRGSRLAQRSLNCKPQRKCNFYDDKPKLVFNHPVRVPPVSRPKTCSLARSRKVFQQPHPTCPPTLLYSPNSRSSHPPSPPFPHSTPD